MRRARHALLTASLCACVTAQLAPAYGPVPGAGQNAGWVDDLQTLRGISPRVIDGTLLAKGDTRVYLVQDFHEPNWDGRKYVRVDMQISPLRFTIDLSNVPCGCMACVYLVRMKDPEGGNSQYCDMASSKVSGLDGEVLRALPMRCVEPSRTACSVAM